MNIQEQLMADLKTALQAHDELTKSTIRMALAALKNARVDKRADLTPAEMASVIQKQIKQRQDSISEYRRGGRQDLADQEAAEITILERYLPKMLERAEIEALVRQIIAETGASSPQSMGVVMKALMPHVQGRADGRLVSSIVKELLT